MNTGNQSASYSREALRSLSDDDWFAMLCRSLTDSALGLPGFPSENIQKAFVGYSGVPALKEAFDFYSFLKSNMTLESEDARILDFGVGWGRLLRFFLKDVKCSNLFGVDIDAVALREAKSCGLPCQLILTGMGVPLPFDPGQFDLIYSYGVISHLSEILAGQTVSELCRLLAPGGLLIFPANSEEWLLLCAESRRKSGARSWKDEARATMFPEPERSLEDFKKGRFVFSPGFRQTPGLMLSPVLQTADYGYSVIPKGWVEHVIQPSCHIKAYHPQLSPFYQAMYVIERTASRAQPSDVPLIAERG